MKNGKNGIYPERNFCASCKHWGTSEPYIDPNNPDGEVSYPICTNKEATDHYEDYKPSDCYACELYEREGSNGNE